MGLLCRRSVMFHNEFSHLLQTKQVPVTTTDPHATSGRTYHLRAVASVHRRRYTDSAIALLRNRARVFANT